MFGDHRSSQHQKLVILNKPKNKIWLDGTNLRTKICLPEANLSTKMSYPEQISAQKLVTHIHNHIHIIFVLTRKLLTFLAFCKMYF